MVNRLMRVDDTRTWVSVTLNKVGRYSYGYVNVCG